MEITAIKEFIETKSIVDNLRSMHQIETPLTIVEEEDHFKIGFDYNQTRIEVNATLGADPIYIVTAEDVDSPSENETHCKTLEDVEGTIEAFIELF
jgi:hypothetical protein